MAEMSDERKWRRRQTTEKEAETTDAKNGGDDEKIWMRKIS